MTDRRTNCCLGTLTLAALCLIAGPAEARGKPRAPSPHFSVVGEYDGVHKHWKDTVRISEGGRFRRAAGDEGAWTFDGRTLVLDWDSWGVAKLEKQSDGTFFAAGQRFRLTRRPETVSGVYDGVHPHWRDSVHIGADGRYRRGNGDPGSWTYDGQTLVLDWDNWGVAKLARQADGTFHDAAQRFRLTRRAGAPAPEVVRPVPQPRVEPEEKRPPRREKQRAAAPRAMEDDAFAKVLAGMENAGFEAGKVEAFKVGTGDKHLTCAQLVRAIALLGFSASQVDIVQHAAPRILDRDNREDVVSAFTFSADQSKVRRLLE